MIMTFMASPHSYTREDVLELSCHGGKAASEGILRRVISLGAVPAQPGEFTRRAFENGRIDLSRAEAVMGIVSASSASSLRVSLRELDGGTARFIQKCREGLSDLLAEIEASNDFPDEIDAPATAQHVRSTAESIARDLRARSDENSARLIREGVSVVIAGRPNVGKSSLINAITGTDSAIVTPVPGTTRDVMTLSASLHGVRVDLSDTAGQRETGDTVESIGVERAKKAQSRADIVILLIDGSQPLTVEDEELLKNRDDRYIVVVSKKDLRDRPPFDINEDIAVSAVSGEGIDRLTRLIAGKVALLTPQENGMTVLRHIHCAKEAAASLDRAVSSIDSDLPLDMAAVDLWEARRILGEITGEDATEDVIDAVFRNFCVGK